MSAPETDVEQTPAAQLPPWMRRPRGPLGWVGLSIAVALASIVLLVIGLVAVGIALVSWVVRGAIWVVMTVVDWVWFAAHLMVRRPYPFVMRPPIGKDARALDVNDAWVATLPRAIGLAARAAGFLFAPLALMASLVGIVLPGLRARPYIALFNVPALEAKLVAIGRNHGFFDDGQAVTVRPYDVFLQQALPQRADFLVWWRDSHASDTFRPSESWNTPRHFSGLTLGPYPDELGLPGLALTAMRRTRIGGLRELFISQREIDDLGDPDLDDRADVAVIRVVAVDNPLPDGAGTAPVHSGGTDARPGRRWIVQFPSTQTWHPRAGRAPNDLTADFVALSMHETTLTRAAVEAMRQAGIRTGEPVLVAGFSLGGMVAAQVADLSEREGFTVTHLITAGSPIARYRVPRGMKVLSLEHVLDSVPRLAGRQNPVIVPHVSRADASLSQEVPPSPESPAQEAGVRQRYEVSEVTFGTGARRAAVWITVKAGPPLPRGYRIAVTHHSPSYAETAGTIEAEPPAAAVGAYVDDVRPFFAGRQVVSDYAAQRVGFDVPRPAVPVYFHSTVDDGVTRDHLRVTLRRVPGVIAVDIYPSRTGFPTTILWSADVLVHSLRPWFQEVGRASVYTGLLTLLARERGIGLHLRLQAKRTPGVTWEATLQRMSDGRWRERVDVSFDTDAAREEWGDLLMPSGWASKVTYYEPTAFV
ncbi:thioesterase domain-containing protein [Humibacter ginsenosidimutans]|uniref:Thioesterase domain-containing protein n=1 Tax=Humibacter ginsenosidimutans TaxID=2599293 RepID=A0A5B8M649_9MICO|nr:hypothetical protein [Humibacter ginsenosidimutans]QDZ16067.1 hypothetical protein FPZ11_15985 [Humibacter ginsenosidimutans]